MADQRQLEILKKGPRLWNEFRERKADLVPDLVEADLRGADLTEVNFKRANLKAAKLDRANLTRAKLGGANLRGANLPETNLRWADLGAATLRQANLIGANLGAAILMDVDLTRADLTEADLTKADLIWAVFSTASLDRTKFDQSHLHRTVFADVDLSAAKGLEAITHEGPSTIGIDTIYRSGGNIPEVFLRGCGVPDSFIAHAKALVGKPIEFYSCFISYSELDQEFAERLCADLQAKRLRCWYFPESAKWGEPVWGEIDQGIKVYDKLIVICSQHSLVSRPVLREIERALQREDREGRNVLFPLRIDEYLFEQWEHPRKADVLSKVVGDFRGWDHGVEKYRLSFEKLLKALRAEDVPSIQPV